MEYICICLDNFQKTTSVYHSDVVFACAAYSGCGTLVNVICYLVKAEHVGSNVKVQAQNLLTP